MPSPRSTWRLTSSPLGSVTFSPVDALMVNDSLPVNVEDIINRTVAEPVRPATGRATVEAPPEKAM